MQTIHDDDQFGDSACLTHNTHVYLQYNCQFEEEIKER